MDIRDTNGGEVATLMERILYEVKKVVVGQDHFLERVLVAILAQGHLLVEGVPGLAKTLTVKTLARAVRGSFKRIQFTPDLVPADLVGTRIYNQKDNSGDRRPSRQRGRAIGQRGLRLRHRGRRPRSAVLRLGRLRLRRCRSTAGVQINLTGSASATGAISNAAVTLRTT